MSTEALLNHNDVPALINRGVQERKLTAMQPFRFLLSLSGLSPARTVLNVTYQAWVVAWLLLTPILLFYMSTHTRSKFTQSTLMGAALLSLSPLVSQAFLIGYLRSGEIEDELVLIEALGVDPATIPALVGLHSLGTVVIAGIISTFWIVNYYLAFKNYPLDNDWTHSRTRWLFAFMSIAVIHSVGAFIFAIALFSIVAAMVRSQGDALAAKIATDRTLSAASIIRMFRELKISVTLVQRRFGPWTFLTVLIFVFSMAFQAVGYVSQRFTHLAKRFNGSYYLIPAGFVLIVLVGIASSITAKVFRVRSAIVSLYSANVGADSAIVALSSTIESASLEFTMGGIAMTPQLTNFIIYAIFCAAGVAAWETLY
eukprot:c53348_g1_i1.p1 GENE.c53348_g1_i1~~c53348_g1_i1.p1  ORF type:complete len:370 (-),score=61.08 c53348_g1_i1:358-1467(-)